MNETSVNLLNISCPLPMRQDEKIALSHGSGGFMTHELIKNIFQKHFSNSILDEGNDAAIIEFTPDGGRLVTSIDAHIVSPLFYPGGDIGRLAVSGTVNDIAMMGAKPLYLTASFIIEEGFSIETLEKIAISMQSTCLEAGVKIIAGDTKVTQKGKGDGLYISTTGLGWLPDNRDIRGQNAKVGDSVLVTGTLGDHGIAILQARGELGFESDIQSDVNPLNQMLDDLLNEVLSVHVMRDPTRGGLGTTLVEISRQSNVCIQVEEDLLPIRSEVRTACEMLGFDPIYIANEGKAVIILPESDAEKALSSLQRHPYGKDAVKIGSVIDNKQARVLMQTPFGSKRIIEMLSGEMLPRIC